MQYVIGDVHCTYYALEALINKLNIDENKDIIYFVGDIMDRQMTKGCLMHTVRWFNDKLTNHGNCYKLVIGNHDLDYAYLSNLNKDLNNYEGLHKYNDITEKLHHEFSDDERMEIETLCDHLAKAPLYREVLYNDIKYIITHSWLVNDMADSCVEVPEEADTGTSIWDRYYSNRLAKTDNIIVIHGHTPTIIDAYGYFGKDKGMVSVKRGNINVECGAPFIFTDAGNLAAYCIETGESVYAYTDEEYSELLDKIIDTTDEIECYGRLILGEELEEIKMSAKSAMSRSKLRDGYYAILITVFEKMLLSYLNRCYP